MPDMEGGGSILPTETGFFTRKEQQNHWRLGCQVKIREDLTIKVPEAVLGIKKWECEVVSNRNVATFIKEFVVRLPEGESLILNPEDISRSMFQISRQASGIFQLRMSSGETGINLRCGI